MVPDGTIFGWVNGEICTFPSMLSQTCFRYDLPGRITEQLIKPRLLVEAYQCYMEAKITFALIW